MLKQVYRFSTVYSLDEVGCFFLLATKDDEKKRKEKKMKTTNLSKNIE